MPYVVLAPCMSAEVMGFAGINSSSPAALVRLNEACATSLLHDLIERSTGSRATAPRGRCP
eukprot:6113538-Prymnesium_polylepis.1